MTCEVQIAISITIGQQKAEKLFVTFFFIIKPVSATSDATICWFVQTLNLVPVDWLDLSTDLRTDGRFNLTYTHTISLYHNRHKQTVGIHVKMAALTR